MARLALLRPENFLPEVERGEVIGKPSGLVRAISAPHGYDGYSDSNYSATHNLTRERQRRREALEYVMIMFRARLHLPDPGIVETVLGTVAANLLPGDPVWLLLVGPSGSGKSEVLKCLDKLKKLHHASTITEAALLSGTASRERARNATGGLLREMGKFGILVLKDLTSILSGPRDARNQLLAALREIHDGSWVRRLGVEGGKNLKWQGKMGLIAGVTWAIDTAHGVTSSMGERFLMYRLPRTDDKRQARSALAHGGEQMDVQDELAEAVLELFEDIDAASEKPVLSDADVERLIALSTLVAVSRSAVVRDPYKRDIEYVPEPEAPGRLVKALSQLHAGLRMIEVDASRAWHLIFKTGMDSIPPTRRALLESLCHAREPVATAGLTQATGQSEQTVRRSLQDLECHGIIERVEKKEKKDLWRIVAEWKTRYETARGSAPGPGVR